jgi:isoleucyl-tRNA synthetase
VRLAERPPQGAGTTYDSQDIPGLGLVVVPAQALGWKKCERCWTWSANVGADPRHPTLCERCLPVVLAHR